MTSAGRLRRWRWVLLVLCLSPLLVWLGVTIFVKLTVAEDVPFFQLLALVGTGLAGPALCLVRDCDADLPEGMTLTVFDDRLLAATPVALEVDERGRVLVAETARQNAGAEDNRSHEVWLLDDLASRTVDDRRAYYRKWIERGHIEDPDHFVRESDRVVVLEDADGDGVADRRQELASWNEMASGLVAGVEARDGEIWVTSIPSVHRILDRDFDGVAEASEVLHSGFGVKTSLIGHDLHGLAWGPDGRIYFSMGDRGYHVTLADGRVLAPEMGPGRGAVFRMNPDGSGLEVFATGVRNPQELAFDAEGHLFTGDNNGDGGDAARIVYVVEGGETGWAMPYQTLAGDYVRGPWVAERLWALQHPTQPAWVLPPVAHLGNGPAGFLHHPGLGLPDRYRDHFFLCDYGYTLGRSGIWSFALEPKGAGFELADEHRFVWSILATDVDFSWDGRLFVSVYDQFGERQQIVALEHPESRADPRVARLAELARTPTASLGVDELVALLDFPDQRLRLRMQYALAERGEVRALAAVAVDPARAPVARFHALWGLGQIGPEGVRAIAPEGFGWERDTAGESDSFRAQLARVAGEGRAAWLVPALVEALGDPSLRVRFFAAQSLGALAEQGATAARRRIPELVTVLRENADRDVFLRHAVVHALHRIGDLDAVHALSQDPDRSVRLAALLVLRRAGDPRVAERLVDPDELIRVEAARAIYDGPIPAAMPALAALADEIEPAEEEDRQVARALHRRVIGANVALRSALGATRLARYAADERQLETLRELALEALRDYSEPPPRDLTMGFYRPLEPVDPALVVAVFEQQGRPLLASSLGARAMEIASALDAVPLDDAELLERAAGGRGITPEERAAAIGALASRVAALGAGADPAGLRAGALRSARAALDADVARVRMTGRELLARIDPDGAVPALVEATGSGARLRERQQAWTLLGGIATASARAAIGRGLARWQAGELEPGVGLELLEASALQDDPGLRAQAEAGLSPPVDAPPVAGRRWALDGGDPEAGRIVFQTTGDCQRCHAAEGGGGHGGGVGPPLRGVAVRDAAHVLESIVAPNARIAPGYGTIVVTRRDGTRLAGLLVEDDGARLVVDVGGGEQVALSRDEIAARTEPVSGMPPVGLGLTPRALRDVVAYVRSLE